MFFHLALLTLENEVSSQLQRFFQQCMNLFEGIRMKSVVISAEDEDVRDAFAQGIVALEQSWRRGTSFMF
jgi:hypothetical protein